MLAFLVATACLGLGVGLARPTAGLTLRYTTLASVAMCCIFFAWQLFLPRVAGLSTPLFLCLIAGAFVPINMEAGLAFGEARRELMEAVQRDIRDGVPVYSLVRQYSQALTLSRDDGAFADNLKALHRAGVKPFQPLREDPPFRSVEVPLVPVALHQIRWHDRTGQGNDSQSYLTLALPRPEFVCRIRLRYSYSNSSGISPHLQVYWKGPRQAEFLPGQCYATRCRTGQDATMTINVAETIDRIRICPDDRPFVFELQQVVLDLLAADDPRAESKPAGSAHTVNRLPTAGSTTRRSVPGRGR